MRPGADPRRVRLALTVGLALAVATGCRGASSYTRGDEPASPASTTSVGASSARAPVDRGPKATNSNGTPKRFAPAPPDVPGKMHVFVYEDFGPQAMAGELLGPECYPFGACCCSEPSDTFDVRVVVHRGVEPSEVARRHPTGPDLGDYRFVPLAKARAYLVARIAELREGREPDDGEALRALELRLERTLASLDRFFSPEPRPRLRDASP